MLAPQPHLVEHNHMRSNGAHKTRLSRADVLRPSTAIVPGRSENVNFLRPSAFHDGLAL